MPEGTETVVATETAPVFKWADNDGKFVDGWRDNLDESIRGEKCLDVIPDVPTMAKNYVKTQKMRGADWIPVPTAKSSQEEWDAFYEKIGRPKAAQDYKFEKSPDIPDDLWDPESVEKLKQLAFKEGFTAKHIAALEAFENERMKSAAQKIKEAEAAQQAEAESALATERAEAEAVLKKKWGSGYDEKIQLAKAFIAKSTADENREAVLSKLGNDPVLIEWCSDWGMKTSESKGLDATQFRTATPSAIKDKIDQLRSTPGYMNGELKTTDKRKFEQVHGEVTKLYSEMDAE